MITTILNFVLLILLLSFISGTILNIIFYFIIKDKSVKVWEHYKNSLIGISLISIAMLITMFLIKLLT